MEELPTPIVVRVGSLLGGEEIPIAGQIVSWVVVEGGGSVFAGTATTNALGEARERWTLGPVAGAQVLEARAVDPDTGEPIVFGRITATAEPGPAASLTLHRAEHRMFLGESFDVASLVNEVNDQYGNRIANPPLVVTATAFMTNNMTISSASEILDTVTVASGAATGSMIVTVVRNLTELTGAKGSYACEGRERRYFFDDRFESIVTRLAVQFTVDSVSLNYTYRHPDDPKAAAVLWVTKIQTVRLEDGTIRVLPTWQDNIVVATQTPGRIYTPDGGGNREGLPPSGWLLEISDDPLTYQGGPFCRDWGQLPSYEPFTITQG